MEASSIYHLLIYPSGFEIVQIHCTQKFLPKLVSVCIKLFFGLTCLTKGSSPSTEFLSPPSVPPPCSPKSFVAITVLIPGKTLTRVYDGHIGPFPSVLSERKDTRFCCFVAKTFSSRAGGGGYNRVELSATPFRIVRGAIPLPGPGID